MKTITKETLFDFIGGWDFQPAAQRLQVIKDFFISEPAAAETEYSAMDWNDLPANVREALHDECADGPELTEFAVVIKVIAKNNREAVERACELLNAGADPDAVLTCPISFPDPDREGQTVTL